jgi:2-dehydropantoate 2-reductase
MKDDNARILVIGAGVNGSACATILHKSGIDVTIMARGKRYDEIREDGIIIENPINYEQSVTKVKVINTLKPDDFYDYIFVIMRKNQALELLPILAQNRSPNIVFMGNTLASPDEYTHALGKDRVLLGSVYAGGKRDGNVIRAIVKKSNAVPFGEIDGSITPRLKKLISTLNRGVSKAKLSTCIVDRLVTHAVVIPSFANLTIKHGCDIRALAKSTADLNLMVDAMRESYSVIQSLGYRIVPQSDYLLMIIPKFILVAIFRKLLSSKYGEVGMGYHISQAPDEMRHLSQELKILVEKSRLPVPALRAVLDLQPQ